LRQELELSDAPRALTQTGAGAIGAGVAAADYHDASIARFFNRVEQ
jgi:hypothetical protein